MAKKNIYMFQPDYLNGNTAYLPYAAAALVAYAKNDPFINNECEFCEIFFIREDPDTAAERLQEPFAVGFSNYVWNFEYNKETAKRIKKRFPECTVIFGGHHVPPTSELLCECDFIDYLIHGEGEEVFSLLLKAVCRNESVADIPNISYRENGKAVTTDTAFMTGEDYPSPYTTGCFDKILKDYPDIRFFSVIETTRGCPYSCSYCDWGNLNKKLKVFPESRVYSDIEWLASHGIDGFGAADSNFGILQRDEEITSYIAKKGCFKAFQSSYAKNSNDRIFRMAKELDDSGINKGITLSFQTLSDEAAENIGRHNIKFSNFAELLRRYNEAHIATYSELILGLPGETCESFCDGIDKLLEAGQHNSIYVHNCEWLPCSGMGNRDYMEKYKISYSVVPLSQAHRDISENDSVTEYSAIVTGTCSMTNDDWIRMNLFSSVVQCCHHGGLLLLIAVLLHYEKGIRYSDFYKKLIAFFENDESTLFGKLISDVKKRLRLVTEEKESLIFSDERFGSVAWPTEEYMYLVTMYEADRFYKECKEFFRGFSSDTELLSEAQRYQQFIIKNPERKECKEHFSYDFKAYLDDALKCREPILTKKDNICKVPSLTGINDFKDFAKYIVWFGKKTVRKVFTDEVEQTF